MSRIDPPLAYDDPPFGDDLAAHRESGIHLRVSAPLEDDASRQQRILSIWRDLDTETSLRTLRLDAMAAMAADAYAAHLARIVREDVDDLSEALFALYLDTLDALPEPVAPSEPWFSTVRRMYEWIGDAVDRLADALEIDGDDFHALAATLRPVVAASTAFVRGIVDPLLRLGIAQSRFAGDEGGARRLVTLRERAVQLDVTLHAFDAPWAA